MKKKSNPIKKSYKEVKSVSDRVHLSHWKIKSRTLNSGIHYCMQCAVYAAHSQTHSRRVLCSSKHNHGKADQINFLCAAKGVQTLKVHLSHLMTCRDDQIYK